MLLHEEQSGRFLRRPKQDYPAATVAEFCTAVLTLRTASMTTDWRGAMAEALACADVLPARCQDDFDGVGVKQEQVS